MRPTIEQGFSSFQWGQSFAGAYIWACLLVRSAREVKKQRVLCFSGPDSHRVVHVLSKLVSSLIPAYQQERVKRITLDPFITSFCI